jgi:signal transduction histidine kinase
MGIPQNVKFIGIKDISEKDRNLSQKEKRALDAVNEKVAAGESLEDILDFLFEKTASFNPCDRISLAFMEENGARAISYLSKASYSPMLLKKGFWQDLSGSSLETILKKNKPRIINNLEEYHKERPDSPSCKLLIKEGVRSSMTCPLIIDGRKIGFMFRSSRKKSAYNPHHVFLHLSIAERLSQAIEKAYRIEQLETANISYIEMLGFVSHELKSPLASITMDATLLTEGYLGKLTEKQEDKIKQMISKSEYLMSLIKDYLDLARIEGGTMEPNINPNVNLCEIAASISYSLLDNLFKEKNIDFACDHPPEEIEAECDYDMMRIVLINLLSNAVKYAKESGKVRLKIRKDQGSIFVSVWNEGPGFPPEQKSNLYKKFSRLKTPELIKQKGTGVGLYTVWRIIKLHGGQVDANSEEGKWAEFSFTIPQPCKINGNN